MKISRLSLLLSRLLIRRERYTILGNRGGVIFNMLTAGFIRIKVSVHGTGIDDMELSNIIILSNNKAALVKRFIARDTSISIVKP